MNHPSILKYLIYIYIHLYTINYSMATQKKTNTCFTRHLPGLTTHDLRCHVVNGADLMPM